MKRSWMLAVLGCLLLFGCQRPDGTLRPAMWQQEPPAIAEVGDQFTIRLLELDATGQAKDPRQLAALDHAAQKADDIFIFIHGWRRDAHDIQTMKAFLSIYRGAFDCLSSQDEEGTRTCAVLHVFCHPRKPESKLVLLVLWDGYSGPFGFGATQARAEAIGRHGLYDLLSLLHARLDGRGTLLALGHSLGGAMLASALQRCTETGSMPLDAAILVVGAFDAGRFKDLRPAPVSEGSHLLVLNLFNPHDGYLHLYRWLFDRPAAGERGLEGIASVRGGIWAQEGSACNSRQVTTRGPSMWDACSIRTPPRGSALMLLNLDMDGLVRNHVDIEEEGALRLYNRAAAEVLYKVLWTKAEEEDLDVTEPGEPALPLSASDPKQPTNTSPNLLN
jgi:hypothetical protein